MCIHVSGKLFLKSPTIFDGYGVRWPFFAEFHIAPQNVFKFSGECRWEHCATNRRHSRSFAWQMLCLWSACGRAGRHNECCSGWQYQPLQHRPYKWWISILPQSQFTKRKGNLRFRRLVLLFVPIGVCVTTHDDGPASDVTIGMWRHNQQVTNHERNGKPWFSLPKQLSHVICKWWYAFKLMKIRKYVQVMP